MASTLNLSLTDELRAYVDGHRAMEHCMRLQASLFAT